MYPVPQLWKPYALIQEELVELVLLGSDFLQSLLSSLEVKAGCFVPRVALYVIKEVLRVPESYVIRTSWVFGPGGRSFLSRPFSRPYLIPKIPCLANICV